MSHSFRLSQHKTRNLIRHAIWLVGILTLYWILFFIPLPPQFKRQGIFLTDEFLLVVLLLVVFLTYQQSGWGVKYLRLGLVSIAFTLPLLRLWQTAESTWNIVLGLLPWADATEYYFDTNRLISGDLFSAFSGRRPIFASLLAVLLKLSGQNLQVVLIVFTVITALVVFLFIEEIRNELGVISAIVALYLSQLFYRPFVGTTLTEQLGYPMGLLGIIVLIRAVKTAKLWLFSVGIMLLTYALLIRAGTFFVLPILMLFGVINFSKNWQQYLKVFSILVVAVAIPVLSNTWLGRTVASPNAVEFANFADTLYGQARGGVRWTQAVIDHPELNSMVEPKRSTYLYGLAFEEIVRNPFGLIKGSLKAFADFFRPGFFSAFGFLTFGNKTVDSFFQLIAALIFLFGLWVLWKDRENKTSALLLAYWAGTFFSIPFLPPIDAGIRPYAATIASLFLPICFAVSPRFLRSRENSQSENEGIPVSTSYTLALALLLASFVGAPLLKAITTTIYAPPITCVSGLTPVSFQLSHGSYISLSSTAGGNKTKVPVVLLSDVTGSFANFAYSDFASIVRKIKQPALLAAATDISTGRGIWVVAPSNLNAYENQVISACAEMVVATYPVMFIKTIENP